MDNKELLVAMRKIVREELELVKKGMDGLKDDVSGLKTD